LMLLPTLERSESHLFSLICFSVVVWDHFHEQLADCDRSQLFPSDHEKSGSQRILLKCFWMSPGWKSRTVEFDVLLSFFKVIRKSHAVTWNIPYMSHGLTPRQKSRSRYFHALLWFSPVPSH
jgi:hypothetical protein